MRLESADENLNNSQEEKERENVSDKPDEFEWGIEAINRLAKMEKYVGKMKFDADLAYLEMKKEIEAQAGELAAHFFRKARASEGKEKLEHVRALEKLGAIVGEEKYEEILRSFLTNKETVEELTAAGEREVSEAKKKAGFLARWLKKD